jgi:hypothetical protein
MTAEQYTDDVNRLCHRHRIDLRIIPGCRPEAYPIPRIVHALPIVTGKEYCETLHEIGHVVLNHRPEQPREYKEILAWRWAFQHSAEWTWEMMDFKAWALKCWGITNPSRARAEKILLDEFSARV